MTSRTLKAISEESETTLSGIAERCAEIYPIESVFDLRGLLERIEGQYTSLDLIGHSTRGHGYLRIGFTPIDLLERRVEQFFRELGAIRLLQRVGIPKVRLLGCETAVSVAAQRTMAALARILDVEVWGSTKPLMKGHYLRAGFNPQFDHLLIEANDLPLPRCHLGLTRPAS